MEQVNGGTLHTLLATPGSMLPIKIKTVTYEED
jgi:hypothetical protein